MKTSITIFSLVKFFKENKMDVKGFIEFAAQVGFSGVELGYYWKDEARVFY